MGEKESIYSRKEKEEALQEAIKNGGFYGDNGVWNSIIKFPGDKRIYRGRVETLVIKDFKSVYLKKSSDGTFKLPGGSFDKDIPNIDQAVNECQEEARLNVRNIQSTGISMKEYKGTPKWALEKSLITWNGYYTELYIAEYDSKFTGHIDDVDRDPFMLSGKFYPLKEVLQKLRPQYRTAIIDFLRNNRTNIDEKNYNEKTLDSIDIHNMYFLSENNNDGATLSPRIPQNFYTRNGYESQDTPRVCFSTTIDGCLIGIPRDVDGKIFYVHNPADNNFSYRRITNEDVPESSVSKEVWVTSPVKLKMIKRIRVTGKNGDPFPYKFGDSHEGILQRWNYEDVKEEPKLEIVSESKLTSEKRNKLDDSKFGIPLLRKYPLYDKKHVIQAIKMFNHVEKKYEKELAENIISAMDKFHVKYDIVGERNRLYSYIHNHMLESVKPVNLNKDIIITASYINDFIGYYNKMIAVFKDYAIPLIKVIDKIDMETDLHPIRDKIDDFNKHIEFYLNDIDKGIESFNRATTILSQYKNHEDVINSTRILSNLDHKLEYIEKFLNKNNDKIIEKDKYIEIDDERYTIKKGFYKSLLIKYSKFITRIEHVRNKISKIL